MSEQFPLGETSTIYMSGEQLYSIIHYDKHGYRQQVALLPEKAQEIRDVVKTAIQEAEQRGKEQAWDEGYQDGYNDGLSDGHNLDNMRDPNENPYRTDQEGDDE